MGKRLPILHLLICLLLVGASVCTASASASMVLTQLPTGGPTAGREPMADGMLRADYGVGARLVMVVPDGTTKALSEGFHSACDPALSFDGTRILFAAQRAAGDDWNIYEMALDGSSTRQITRGLGDCRSPEYQSSLYTLKPVGVPSVPEYHLTFVSGAGTMNESGGSEARSLFSCKFDGSTVRQLTYNLSDDFDPDIQPDGRLVFASWQRSWLHAGPDGRIELFGLNIDGSDFAGLTIGQGKRIKTMPCVIPQGLIVFVEADAVGWDGAGSLGSVTLRRPLHSYRSLTTENQGLFHSPSAMPDGRILVSRRARDGSDTFGIFAFDPDGGQLEAVFDDPQWHDIQAKPVFARPEPDGRASAVPEDVDASARSGKFYCLNVYTSDLQPSWLPPGTIKRLRVLEGVGLPNGTKANSVGIPALAPRRILGEVPIEKDGSFNIEIPANTPIELQTLDADGMALRRCGWIWTKDYARQGCVGCHEDPELTPENTMVDAVKHPSLKLTPAAAERRTVDFQHDVMPIIKAKCVRCHAGARAPVRFTEEPSVNRTGFNQAYENLLTSTADAPRGKYVHPGQARTSPLIWRLHERNTSRPWDETRTAESPGPMPPTGASALTADEKRTFVEWIDLGALWDGAPVAQASPADNGGG